MVKAKIVYTSLTGNTLTCMHVVQDRLEELGYEVEAFDSTQAPPTVFDDAALCLVGTYTYGDDGDLPDDISDFYEELAELDLRGKVFGVFGSGDSYYPAFCKSVDDFEKQFMKTGAVKGADNVKVEFLPNEQAILRLREFADRLSWWQKRMH